MEVKQEDFMVSNNTPMKMSCNDKEIDVLEYVIQVLIFGVEGAKQQNKLFGKCKKWKHDEVEAVSGSPYKNLESSCQLLRIVDRKFLMASTSMDKAIWETRNVVSLPKCLSFVETPFLPDIPAFMPISTMEVLSMQGKQEFKSFTSTLFANYYCSFILYAAQSFLTALQDDERASFQLDVKFQESYLSGEHVNEIIGAAVADGNVTPKAVCLAAYKKLYGVGALMDMLFPNKGSGEDENVEQTDVGDPLPGIARHLRLATLKSFQVRLMRIVLDVDVEPSTIPWDPAKAFLFVPKVGNNMADPVKDIDWDLVEQIVQTDAWNSPQGLSRCYLGTNEWTLGGDRREYGYGKLHHGMTFGQKSHPTYSIRGAVAQYDILKASGLVPNRDINEMQRHANPAEGKLMMFDAVSTAEDLVGRIVTAAHSGKRFYVDLICYNMTAESSVPRKEGYLGPLEYSSYADYNWQKYGSPCGSGLCFHVDWRCFVSSGTTVVALGYHLLPIAQDDESEEILDKMCYVYLPPELCFVHPLPRSLVQGAQRLPSIMRVESMLLAIQLNDIIGFPVPSSKILESLTAASCQETFCNKRAELLGDAYLKWVVS
ncbi:PAZ domain [Dillenia turbinata]|uniref:PAZ domain n=1 Tax=Dillenia turbinata TaxID=194707 RepID=A0AAN8VEE3_9MAGN